MTPKQKLAVRIIFSLGVIPKLLPYIGNNKKSFCDHFTWTGTTEGDSFWRSVHNTLSDNGVAFEHFSKADLIASLNSIKKLK